MGRVAETPVATEFVPPPGGPSDAAVATPVDTTLTVGCWIGDGGTASAGFVITIVSGGFGLSLSFFVSVSGGVGVSGVSPMTGVG